MLKLFELENLETTLQYVYSINDHNTLILAGDVNDAVIHYHVQI